MRFEGLFKRICRFALVFALVNAGIVGMAWAERLAVSVETANIRSGPSTEYQLLWRVEKYTPIEVISRQGEWVFFKDFESTRGWIHNSLTSDIPTVITKKDMCNIRSGPGTANQVLFQAKSGVPFKVIERKGAWLNILHADGDKGWIHEQLVW